jgi:hypothetical protein
LNNVESPLGYVACFLNSFFDVFSVIRRLHNLWSPFKIRFISFRPLLSRLGHTLFIIWRPYAAFHGMARKCHIKGSMITAVWTHLRMFLNSKFYYFRFKCWILLKSVLGGVDGNLHFQVPFSSFRHNRLKTLVQRLENVFGIAEKLLEWITSYLQDRKQTVYINGVLSKPVTLNFSVPQGSVLGPKFYTMYT